MKTLFAMVATDGNKTMFSDGFTTKEEAEKSAKVYSEGTGLHFEVFSYTDED